MGCTSSKHVKTNVVADVYKPPPSSFAVFDINAIEEPWLKLDREDDEKPTRAAAPVTVLHTLQDNDDDAPKTWDEVSKSLETHLKPAAVQPPEVASVKPPATPPRRLPRKSASFHTLDELETRAVKDMAAQNPTKTVKLKKTESMSELRPEFARTETARNEPTQPHSGSRSVKENIFVLRDRERREKEGNKKPVMNWDPLREFPEKCPPGGGDGLVVYTTSLQGVRRTYEDCMRVRAIMEQQGVVVDERDVALDAGVLSELKELLQDEATVAPPRVFVKGRYLGGGAEVTAMNENGKLGRVLRWARVARVGEEGRHTCEGCGGARWVPCLGCGGSCKVAAAVVAAKGEGWERCVKCNENGLIRCPVCFV